MDVPDVVWQIVWINLTYGSPIARWYKEKVSWNKEFTDEEIRNMVQTDYPADNKTTIKTLFTHYSEHLMRVLLERWDF